MNSELNSTNLENVVNDNIILKNENEEIERAVINTLNNKKSGINWSKIDDKNDDNLKIMKTNSK